MLAKDLVEKMDILVRAHNIKNIVQAHLWTDHITPEGKKIYSTKLRFDYTQGEAKQLLFSLTADKFQQGNYILNIYQNGKLIGKIVKTLS